MKMEKGGRNIERGWWEEECRNEEERGEEGSPAGGGEG